MALHVMDEARTAMRSGSHQVTCFSLTQKITASEYEFSYASLEAVAYSKRVAEAMDEYIRQSVSAE